MNDLLIKLCVDPVKPEKLEAMAKVVRSFAALSVIASEATAGAARLAQEFERKKIAETIRAAVVHRDLDMVHRLALLRRM